MTQQHRNPQEQESQHRWRGRYYGDRSEEERNREGEPGWDEQSGRRSFGGFSRGGESEQSGWRRDSDEDRWSQGGGSRRYQQGQEYGRGELYGGGQQQGYGSSRQYEQGGYGRSQYGQREQGGYGGSTSYQRGGFGGEQRSYGESREPGRSASSEWRPEESSRERQDYGRQYESQSFDQPFPPGFQGDFGSSRGATRYGAGREGYSGYGSHRGKGPKGYTRSDDRLKEIICEKLTDDPMIDASEISVEVTSQIVKLTGTVDDRSTKYEIEELIERCGGVKDIDNQLRVRSGSSQSLQMGAQGGSREAAGGSYGSGTTQSGSGAQTTSQSGREGSSGSSGTKRTNS